MKQLQDQLKTFHTFETFPKRIISLVPSQTELLVDLGLEENIVGITKFCIHPSYLKKSKTIIGGTKNIYFDKIKALQPDIIIANKEENTIEIVSELSKICPVWVTDIYTIEDNFKMIQDFGALFDKKNEAQKLTDEIKLKVADFKIFIKDRSVVKTAYFIWAKPYMVAGNNTFINEILNLNRFENVYQNTSRYPEIEINKWNVEDKPELILLSSEPFPFKQKHADEIRKIVPDTKILFVDGELFSWYGSRLLKAFDYFKTLHEKL